MTRELFTRVEIVEDARHNAEVLQRIQIWLLAACREDEARVTRSAVMEPARSSRSEHGLAEARTARAARKPAMKY